MSRKKGTKPTKQLLRLVCRASTARAMRRIFGPTCVRVIETPTARRMIVEVYPFN